MKKINEKEFTNFAKTTQFHVYGFSVGDLQNMTTASHFCVCWHSLAIFLIFEQRWCSLFLLVLFSQFAFKAVMNTCTNVC